jgi:hypothetical protein
MYCELLKTRFGRSRRNARQALVWADHYWADHYWFDRYWFDRYSFDHWFDRIWGDPVRGDLLMRPDACLGPSLQWLNFVRVAVDLS